MTEYKGNIIYKLIDILFLTFAILVFFFTTDFSISLKFSQLLGAMFFIFIIHTLKFIKTYFILLEEKLPISKILSLYLKTTFVSIIIPFKIGELFKVYSYGHEMKNYLKGFILVLVDKLFDAIIICSILIGYSLVSLTKVSILGWLLLIFIIGFLIVYFTFPNTYSYLNKFFINKRQNKRNLFILEILEILNDIYIKVKEMINGRSLILFVLTFIYWLFEMLYILFITKVHSLKSVIDYINDSFLGITNSAYNIYIYACIIVFVILFIGLYLFKIYSRSETNEKSNSSLR